MKIKVILASSSQELVRSQLANRQKALAPGTEITIVAPSKCPPSTEGEVDEILAAPQILKEARIAIDKDGAEVIVLGCTVMGSIADELSSHLRVPVIEPGTAAIKLAEVLTTTGWISAQSMRKKKE